MRPSLQAGRKPSSLSAPVHQRLNTYALAAGAAGVSLLALAPPSEAKIVYTPANETIGRGGRLRLDLNQDGILDFLIVENGGATQFGTNRVLSIEGKTGNQVNCASEYCGSAPYAAALGSGSQIGVSARRHGWINPTGMAIEALRKGGSVAYSEAWVNVSNRYLGLRFEINGETHFGWARLNVKFHGGPPRDRGWEAQLTGYAYETIARKSIAAGQTKGNDGEEEDATNISFSVRPAAQFTSPGKLALGAEGIALRRREESESCIQCGDKTPSS